MDYKESGSDKAIAGANLIILIAFSITAVILLSEIVINGWDTEAFFITLGFLISAWYLNLIKRLNSVQRVWLYAAFMMFCFFYYGIHQNSLNDLSLSIVVIILVFFIARLRSIIWLAVFTYFFTVLYNLAKVDWQLGENYFISTFELLFQFSLVLLAGFVAHLFITERNAERKNYLYEKSISDGYQDVVMEETRVVAREMGKLAIDIKGELLILNKEIQDKLKQEEFSIQMLILLDKQRQLQGHLTDLKDFSDLMSGKIHNEPEVYEVLNLVSHLKEERQKRDTRNDPDLIIDLDPMTPKAMYGDWEKILKILKHLIDNGIKYTTNSENRGGVHVKIYPRFYGDDCNLCIEVNDTGIGMVNSDRERLLELINSGRASDYRPGGLGLGLCLVTGFTKCMGGFFNLESQWQKGTSICISIPQRVSDAVPCMSYDHKSEMCLAYEDLRFDDDILNSYYEDLFRNFSEKLDLPSYAVKDENDIKKLSKAYRKVCLIVDSACYDKDSSYYEGLENVFLVVLAGTDYVLKDDSKAHLLHKALCTADLVQMLDLAKRTIRRRRRGEDNIEELLPENLIGIWNLSQKNIAKKGGQRILIATDSMADLPPEISEECSIPVIPFRIFPEHSSFLDGLEISQECALNYFNDHGGAIHSMAPDENDFQKFFEENLKYAGHIIYISTAKKVSVAYERALKVAGKLKNVTVVNSGQVSGGTALMAILANEKVKEGKSVEEIVNYLEELRPKIKTTFLIENLDHLAYIGRVSKALGVLAHTFMLHPVIVMKHDSMKMGNALIGNMDYSRERYINSIFKKNRKIDLRYAFVGSVGINGRDLMGLEQLLLTKGNFQKVIMRRASAAISINCGVGTFGIIYVEK
ncbi:MAG: DegV family EDD domain-containing protein [Butyrivibrio sp.]|nr:DegV family EDD domain-containing protein [Butyrivibrio sp.]